MPSMISSPCRRAGCRQQALGGSVAFAVQAVSYRGDFAGELDEQISSTTGRMYRRPAMVVEDSSFTSSVESYPRSARYDPLPSAEASGRRRAASRVALSSSAVLRSAPSRHAFALAKNCGRAHGRGRCPLL